MRTCTCNEDIRTKIKVNEVWRKNGKEREKNMIVSIHMALPGCWLPGSAPKLMRCE